MFKSSAIIATFNKETLIVHANQCKDIFEKLLKMEKRYNASVKYLEFLKDKIEENIIDYSEDELDSYVRQVRDACKTLDENLNLYVQEACNNDVERNKMLDFVELQKPIQRQAKQFKEEIQDQLSTLKIKNEQIAFTEKQKREEEFSIFKEKLEMDRSKRIAENEQKVQSALQDELASLTEERQKREHDYFEKTYIS